MNQQLLEELKQQASYLENRDKIEIDPSWQLVDVEKLIRLVIDECADCFSDDLDDNMRHYRWARSAMYDRFGIKECSS